MLRSILLSGLVITAGAVGSSLARDAARRRRAVAAERAVQAEMAALEDRRRLAQRAESIGTQRALQGEMLRSVWGTRRQALRSAQVAANAAKVRTTQRVAEAKRSVEDECLCGSSTRAWLTALLWAALVVMMFVLDRHLLESVGLDPVQANVLAATVAVLMEALGMLFFAAIGVHPIGFISAARIETRLAIGGIALTLLTAFIVAGLIPLSRSRAEDTVGRELRSAVAVLAELEADPTASEVELVTARLTVEQLRERFDRSVTLSALFSAGLACGAFALSWAPAGAVAHFRLSRAKRADRAADKRILSLATDSAALHAAFAGATADAFVLEGLDPADVAEVSPPRELPPPRPLEMAQPSTPTQWPSR